MKTDAPSDSRRSLNLGYFSQSILHVYFSFFHWNNLTAKLDAFAPHPFPYPNTYHYFWRQSCIIIYLGISEQGTKPSGCTEFPGFSKLKLKCQHISICVQSMPVFTHIFIQLHLLPCGQNKMEAPAIGTRMTPKSRRKVRCLNTEFGFP